MSQHSRFVSPCLVLGISSITFCHVLVEITGSLGHEISMGNLQVDEGLAFGLVPGFNNLPGFVLAAGLQADAFASLDVHAIRCSPTCRRRKTRADSTVCVRCECNH